MTSEQTSFWPRALVLAAAVVVALLPGLRLVRSWPLRVPMMIGRTDVRATALGVMEFAPVGDEGATAWMRDALRDTLSSRLSGSPDCKVFSKEFLDFKAQGLVRKGEHADVRTAVMDVATQLGVTKAIFGHYRVQGALLFIEAYVVDMATGVREPADAVQGAVDRFADLQGRLAAKIMERLSLAPPRQNVAGEGSLDSYKMLLDAEGGAAVDPEIPPADDDAVSSRGDPGARLGARIVAALGPSAAHAQAGGEPRAAILATLDKYRRAYAEKSLALLAEVYGPLSDEQAKAAKRYFENAEDLQVSIEDVDVAVDGERAAVSYTRRDRFNDAKTGEPHVLQVRLTKMMVLNAGDWRMDASAK